MWIKIDDKTIMAEVKALVKRVLRDSLTFKWIREVVEDEVRRLVRISFKLQTKKKKVY
jgi:hypothetical protein